MDTLDMFSLFLFCPACRLLTIGLLWDGGFWGANCAKLIHSLKIENRDFIVFWIGCNSQMGCILGLIRQLGLVRIVEGEPGSIKDGNGQSPVGP